MSDLHSVPALLKVLGDGREEGVVRHKAAKALGGIATDDLLPVLRTWATTDDVPRVVRESCVVAVDTCGRYVVISDLSLGASNGLDRVGLVQATA